MFAAATAPAFTVRAAAPSKGRKVRPARREPYPTPAPSPDPPACGSPAARAGGGVRCLRQAGGRRSRRPAGLRFGHRRARRCPRAGWEPVQHDAHRCAPKLRSRLHSSRFLLAVRPCAPPDADASILACAARTATQFQDAQRAALKAEDAAKDAEKAARRAPKAE